MNTFEPEWDKAKAWDYPKPAWRPTKFETPTWVLERAREYTGGRKEFTVYSHGTVVFGPPPNPSSGSMGETALMEVVTNSPDFAVMPMRDGNFVVQFRGNVRGIIDGDFVKAHGEQLACDACRYGLLPGETFIQQDAVVALLGHREIGLYARAKLYMDVEKGLVVAHFAPV